MIYCQARDDAERQCPSTRTSFRLVRKENRRLDKMTRKNMCIARLGDRGRQRPSTRTSFGLVRKENRQGEGDGKMTRMNIT